MTVAIKEPNRAIDLAAIMSLEAKIGSALPGDYRAFLLASNGGQPETNEFAIGGGKNGSGVNCFFGVLGDKPDDLAFENQLMVNRIPPGVIVIGVAEGGNFICLSLRAEGYGQVFFWDHELEAEEGSPASFKNLSLVADSFQQFFEGLAKFDPSQVKLAAGQVKKAWIDPEFLRSLGKEKP